MKTTLKDTQVSLRLSSELLEAMRSEAKAENISLSDFIIKLFQERTKDKDLEKRLEALERFVYQSQAA